MKLKSLFFLIPGIFFLFFFFSPKPSLAQASCSIEEIYQSCGAGTGFACVTPSPTPVALNPWIKVKSSNFSANSTETFSNFSIPETANRYKFNEADTDDPNSSRTFMIGDAGIEPGVLTGPDISNIEDYASSSDWKVNKYTKKRSIDPRKFLDYALSRKDTNTLSSLSQIPVANKINIYKGTTYVIDATNVDNYRTGNLTGPTVVIIDGDLDIQRNINYKQQAGYTTNLAGYTPQPLTIIVTGKTTITSTDPNTVNQINAILVSNDFTIKAMSTPDDYGLKISGNLIVSGDFTNERVREDSRRPVLFVVMEPVMYTSLLPYFSIAQYEWKQVQ